MALSEHQDHEEQDGDEDEQNVHQAFHWTELGAHNAKGV